MRRWPFGLVAMVCLAAYRGKERPMTAVSFENDVREQVHGLMPELWGVLIELVKDRSIYTDPDPPLQMTAEKIAALLVAAGVSTARAEPISYGGRTSAPLVLANEIVHQDLRTVLLYAHYDVQPADPL
jgi:cysteinylglycine-S-conjugate dipeptidase